MSVASGSVVRRSVACSQRAALPAGGEALRAALCVAIPSCDANTACGHPHVSVACVCRVLYVMLPLEGSLLGRWH